MQGSLPLVAALALLTSVVSSQPTNPPKCTIKREHQVAGYEDLPFIEGNANPIPSPYLGLAYKAFQVDEDDGFLKYRGNHSAMLFGIPGALVAQKYDSITLKGLWYACVAGIPQDECEILVVGKKGNGKTVTKKLIYPELGPGPVGSFVMKQATFDDSFKGVKRLEFTAKDLKTGEYFNGGLAIDDVSYVGKKKVCKGGY